MRKDNDRERILVNIACFLAEALNDLQSLPAVREYMAKPLNLCRIRTESGYSHNIKYNKGDLVVCQTSVGRQQHPSLISFVEQVGSRNDPKSGLLLRSIGTNDLCDYGNESFMRITGIPEQFLWEGIKDQFARKLEKAFHKMGEDWHRFRGLEFKQDRIATVMVGEKWGGIFRGDKKGTKPYTIDIHYDRKTTIKSIIKQMREQGYGSREYEPNDEQEPAGLSYKKQAEPNP